jgi:hypothetical protein
VAWPIYSERFISIRGSSNAQVYTVPDGRRAVVKCCSFVTSGAAGGEGYVNVGGTTIYYRIFPGVGFDSLDVMAVAYGGESIEAAFSSGYANMAVSGFEFEDPTHATGPPSHEQLPSWPDSPAPWTLP